MTQTVFIHTLLASLSYTVVESDGFTKISVFNPSASSANVVITGTGKSIGSGGVGTGISLAPGASWTWLSGAYTIDGVTITTDAGTTALITAS